MNHVDPTPTVTHLSLCAGYGGIDLGLHRVIEGLRTIAYCEIEGFAVANLVAKMEQGSLDAAPVWTNLVTFPFGQFCRKVDILTAGFPCQPFSTAGKRKGTEDERHLYPHIAAGISLCRPGLVLFENVEGLASTHTIEHRPDLLAYLDAISQRIDQAKDARTRWKLERSHERTHRYFLHKFGISVLHYVCCDLESRDYTVATGLFTAAETGLPHLRKRVFILAYRRESVLEGYVGNVGHWYEPGRLDPDTFGPVAAGRLFGASPAGRGAFQHWWEPARVVAKAISRDSERGPDITERGSEGGIAPDWGGEDVAHANGQGSLSTAQSGVHLQCSAGTGAVVYPDDGQQQGGGQCAEHEAWRGGIADPGARDPRECPFEPALGRGFDGHPHRLDYAELFGANHDSRIDELRLLGNGVVPAQAAIAFMTLFRQLHDPN